MGVDDQTIEEHKTASDVLWSVETHGVERIGDEERHGKAFELFWVWFAANIGILGVVYGAILVGSGLNIWQSLLVAVLGSGASFGLVGVVSIAGKQTGRPTLMLSRTMFGAVGNIGPSLISWLSLVGWEAVSVITATYALLGLWAIFGIAATFLWTVLSLVMITFLIVVIGLLGHATLVWIQRAATVIFGLLTLCIILLLIGRIDWSSVLSAPPGRWDSGFLAAISIIAAGTGIGWVNTGADYTRYLPRSNRNRDIVGWTVLGSAIPLVALIVTGVLLSQGMHSLASTNNPVMAIESALPLWMAIPYFITVIGGLVVAADLSIYSSGLNLLALGVPLQRYKTVVVDGVLIIAASLYIMLVAHDFLGPFESFLQLLADALTAWAAIFLVNMLAHYPAHKNAQWAASISWLVGIVAGLAFTVSPWFNGPLAHGIFAQSSLGYIIGFAVSAFCYTFCLFLGKSRKGTTR
jgi:nucleobase:cation symporter-1, NCS1 family